MKILYLAHADNYHVKNWVRLLSANGINVQCVGFRNNTEFVPKAIQFSGFSNDLRWLHFSKTKEQIRAIVDEFDPDIIFASFAPTYGLSAILAKTNIPVVVQTWSRDIALPGSLVTLKDHLLVKTVGKWVLNKADGITTDGRECRNHLIKKHPHLESKTLATPWGIDLNFFSNTFVNEQQVRNKFNIPNDAKVIISGRGLFWYYQPETVLSALRQSLETHPDVYTIILGLGHEMNKETKKLIQNLSSHPRVLFFPNLISRVEIRDLWAISDFFISTPIFDGVAESVSEGRAMGAIPILNPISSNLEQAKPVEHAFYSKSSDAGDLVSVINNAISSDEKLLNNIRAKNTAWVQRFANVNHTLDSLVKFFNTILEGNQRQ